MGPYPARERRQLDVGPRGNSLRALAPWAPANQQSAISNQLCGSGFHIVRGGIDQGDNDYRPRHEILSSLGAVKPSRWPEGQLTPRVRAVIPTQPATSLKCWGFHTALGNIDQENHDPPPGVVGVVQIWMDV